MKYCLFDKVKTKNMDGQYNNITGTVVQIFDIDVGPVYTVKYDKPFGSITKGIFKESDLILADA